MTSSTIGRTSSGAAARSASIAGPITAGSSEFDAASTATSAAQNASTDGAAEPSLAVPIEAVSVGSVVPVAAEATPTAASPSKVAAVAATTNVERLAVVIMRRIVADRAPGRNLILARYQMLPTPGV